MTAFANLSVQSNMANGFDPSKVGLLDAGLQEQIARRRAVLGPAYRLMYNHPLQVSRAKGCLIWDRDGREYLDAYNNVVSVGHCHPRVIAAVHEQMQTLCTHTRYLQDGILDFAEEFVATFGGRIRHVMFTCTGSEANDLALQIAMHHTGRKGVIITANAYTGNSALASELSPSLSADMQLPDWVECISPPDTCRLTHEEIVARTRQEITEAIARLNARGHGIAAFIADSLFSSDGVFAQPVGLLRDIADLIHAAGGLVIADEVQAGFGRSGETLWGHQRHGQTPDLVTMGKPMGNGYPVAAVATSADAVAKFGVESRYFNTFGGNNVAIAAARATFDVLREEQLMTNTARIGEMMRRELTALTSGHERIADVRGAGLFIGVEMVRDRDTLTPDAQAAQALIGGLRERGVLISACGAKANTLKIRPPLVFTEALADRFLTEFSAALDEV